MDEIGDMPLYLQPKLLRVLQSGDYNRIGSTKNLRFKGRVIAATNKDLKPAIKKKSKPKFRPDLFYRLNVLPISLPCLRELSVQEREAAILNKLRHIIYLKSKDPGDQSHMTFLASGVTTVFIDKKKRKRVTPNNPFISKEALQRLVNYDFPGNYRELDNIIRRAYILSRGCKIEVSALEDVITESKETESPKYSGIPSGVDATFLKDIVGHAEKIKKDIVLQKVEAVYRSGRNIKRVLELEGMTDEKSYQRIRKRIVGIIGKDEMSRIKG